MMGLYPLWLGEVTGGGIQEIKELDIELSLSEDITVQIQPEQEIIVEVDCL